MKTAFIIGSEGQDGQIAFDLLLNKGYRLLGLGRNTIRNVNVGWNKTVDITDEEAVSELMKTVQVDEIYYLAASHQSSQDRTIDDTVLFKESQEVNVDGLSYFLQGIQSYAPQARLFYAASSLIYGDAAVEIQNENTPFSPDTVYGKSKLKGLLLCRHYREDLGIFASTGILYNHESHYRRETFISKKIIQAAVRIKQGKQNQLVVGDLNAVIDWGYAPDYVEAMYQVLNADQADEFIIASGKKHSVQDFVQITFDLLALDWRKYVQEDPAIMTRKRKVLIGDPQKLMNTLGWRPTVDFKGMIKLLLEMEGACL